MSTNTTREPDTEALARARSASLVFALLVLCTFITSNFALPMKVAGLAFGLAALVAGIRALVVLAKAKIGAGSTIITIMGLALTVFTGLGILGQVILWPVQSSYETCQREALTGQARDMCTSEYTETLEDLQRRLVTPQ